MICKNFNGIVDEMSVLIRGKPHENELMYEFCNHDHCIGAQCLCLHPLGEIVGYYQNVLIISILTNGHK
jgi:hypothetical protein